MFSTIGKKWRGNTSLVWVDKSIFSSFIRKKLLCERLPCLAIYHDWKQKLVRTNKHRIYLDSWSDVTEDIVNEFISDVWSGKDEPLLTSQDPIPYNPSDVLHPTVTSTFYSDILNSTKDSLIFIYAPWCGRSYIVEKVLIEFGEMLRREGLERYLNIYKMDGTQNEAYIQAFSWTGSRKGHHSYKTEI